MKMKSFVMMAMLGLATTYIAPALAEDDMEQMDQGQQMDQMQMLSDSGMSPPSDTQNIDENNKESGSPDTATGDDDY